jgi:signal transduction histidine kinase
MKTSPKIEPLEMELSTKSPLSRLCIFGVLLSLLLVLLNHFAWHGSTELHTLMEVSATLIASFCSVLALFMFKARRSLFLLFLGYGFAGTAALDGYHALVTSQWMGGIWESPTKSLAPWSWNASRFFLAAFLFAGSLAFDEKSALSKQITEKWVAVTAITATITAFVIFAFAPLPPAYYPSFIFGRPWEAGAAILFALAYFFFRKSNVAIKDHLLFALIVNIVCQVLIMPFSFKLFDVMFDVAHLLKIAGYLVVLQALLAKTLVVFSSERRAREEIKTKNIELRKHAVQLESEILNSTKELQRQKIAAINMMEDAHAARQEAEISKADLSRVNLTLETQIKARTSELEDSNRELEAFSYSVSHDLRAPLRHMSGYAKLLHEKFGKDLDPKAQHYIRTISGAAEKMGHLIDDLLDFSRVGRSKLRKEMVSLHELFLEIKEELSSTYDLSKVNWQVGDLPEVYADRSMIRLVFENLIDNALKYSQKKPTQVIEIHSESDEHACKVTISDNGVGFDMAYVGKLFSVFQRLHTDSEFKGTGIGLANVKRMIVRHGGHVGAYGETNIGSTFYFTLPLQKGSE